MFRIESRVEYLELSSEPSFSFSDPPARELVCTGQGRAWESLEERSRQPPNPGDLKDNVESKNLSAADVDPFMKSAVLKAVFGAIIQAERVETGAGA